MASGISKVEVSSAAESREDRTLQMSLRVRGSIMLGSVPSRMSDKGRFGNQVDASFGGGSWVIEE